MRHPVKPHKGDMATAYCPVINLTLYGTVLSVCELRDHIWVSLRLLHGDQWTGIFIALVQRRRKMTKEQIRWPLLCLKGGIA